MKKVIGMEAENEKKIRKSGRIICLAAGMLSAVAGVYWLIRAIFYEDVHMIEMLSSICVALYLVTIANRRIKANIMKREKSK